MVGHQNLQIMFPRFFWVRWAPEPTGVSLVPRTGSYQVRLGAWAEGRRVGSQARGQAIVESASPASLRQDGGLGSQEIQPLTLGGKVQRRHSWYATRRRPATTEIALSSSATASSWAGLSAAFPPWAP